MGMKADEGLYERGAALRVEVPGALQAALQSRGV